MSTIILNSRGLNTVVGTNMIHRKLLELGVKDFDKKTIYAVSHPSYEVDEYIVNNCIEIMGFAKENIYMSATGIPKGVIPDFVYVGEGNSFLILKYMRDTGIVTYIQEIMRSNPNAVYIGSSAGAMIAGSDIMLASDFDSNDVRLMDFTALGLLDGTMIIPHYEKSELRRYITCTEKHILNRYKRICSVGNEEVIVMRE